MHIKFTFQRQRMVLVVDGTGDMCPLDQRRFLHYLFAPWGEGKSKNHAAMDAWIRAGSFFFHVIGGWWSRIDCLVFCRFARISFLTTMHCMPLDCQQFHEHKVILGCGFNYFVFSPLNFGKWSNLLQPPPSVRGQLWGLLRWVQMPGITSQVHGVLPTGVLMVEKGSSLHTNILNVWSIFVGKYR